MYKTLWARLRENHSTCTCTCTCIFNHETLPKSWAYVDSFKTHFLPLSDAIIGSSLFSYFFFYIFESFISLKTLHDAYTSKYKLKKIEYE